MDHIGTFPCGLESSFWLAYANVFKPIMLLLTLDQSKVLLHFLNKSLLCRLKRDTIQSPNWKKTTILFSTLFFSKILKCHRAGMHRRGLWGLFKGLLVWQREDNSLMIFKCSDSFTYTYTPCLHQVHRMKLLAQSLSIFASFNKNPLCCVFSYYTPTLRKISEFFSLWRPRWRRKWKVMELKTF